MYPNNQGDLPRSSSDRDVPHKRTRRMGTPKYLMESCYHCIECFIANFLAAFMWKRPMNSAVLAIPTHKGPKRVSDAASTRVVA